MLTTIGKELIYETLPEDLRDINEPISTDKLDEILGIVAKKHPDKYKEISKKLMSLGANTAFEEGITLNLSDTLLPTESRKFWFDHVAKQRKKILASPGTPTEKEEALNELYHTVYNHLVDDTFKTSLDKNNPFALQVKSKAKGSKLQLTQLLTTPGVYQDAENKTIPLFIHHSYAEGLTPAEYWAALYGARKGVVATKFSTSDAGYLGKQLNAAASNVVVTGDDCSTTNGIPVPTDDVDNIGAVLAQSAGKFKAGTVINRPVLDSLKSVGVENILVRSPMTCGYDKGVCKQCVGLRDKTEFPNVGDYVGIQAASAVAERIAQASLNVKHQGGQKAKSDEDYIGFDLINQFAQVPENFQHRSTLAEVDGKITKIEPAPQGGTNVYINDQLHYVLPRLTVNVKPGDAVEQGDQLSGGIIDPSELIKYKGVGEGRRYFADRFTKLLRDTGFGVHRRNVELLSRAMINHVRPGMDIDNSNTLPGDVVGYNTFAYGYKPRPTSVNKTLDQAHGHYLEQPALHYTIGTRLDNKAIDQLKKFNINTVLVNKDPVDIEPFMPSLRVTPSYDPDWMAQLGTSYLQTNLLKNVQRGATSSIKGLNPLPGVAKGVDFTVK